jgi:hypothetical protein
MRIILFVAAALALVACQKSSEPQAAPGAPGKKEAPSVAPAQKAEVVKTAQAPAGSQPAAAGSQPAAAGSQPAAAGSQPAAAGSQPMGSHAAPGSQPAGGMPPGHPPTGMPAGHPPTGGAVGGTLSGKIDVADALKGDVKAGSVLFIIVRRDAGDGQKGMLIAAKKIPVTGAAMFPVDYVVTPADVMMAGTQLTGAVRVEARVDQDQDAISKTPGDIFGGAGSPAEVGAKGVDFTLDKKI